MRPAALLVPCGGGGLLAGVSTAVRALLPETAIYGVEPENFDDHARSWKSGVRESVPGSHSTLCDSLMTPTPGALTWSINQTTVADFISVSEDEVRHAVSFAFRYLKLVVEPGGAVALAAGDLGVSAGDGSSFLETFTATSWEESWSYSSAEKYTGKFAVESMVEGTDDTGLKVGSLDDDADEFDP